MKSGEYTYDNCFGRVRVWINKCITKQKYGDLNST